MALPAAIAIAPVAALITLAWILRTPPVAASLRDYDSRGVLDHSHNALIWSVARRVLERVGQANAFPKVNGQPAEGQVGLYVLGSDPDGLFPYVDCNCAYVDSENLIICDGALFQQFTELLQVSAYPSELGDIPYLKGLDEERVNANLRISLALINWVITHELGHMALGHKRDNWWQKDVGFQEDRERSADLFYLQSLDSADEKFWIWIGFSSLASVLYTEELNRVRSQRGMFELDVSHVITRQPVINEAISLHMASPWHPPLVVRVLDLAAALVEGDDDIVDEGGYFQQLKSNLKVNEEIGASTTLCEVDYDPAHDLTYLELEASLPAHGLAAAWLQDAEFYFEFAQLQSVEKWATKVLGLSPEPEYPDGKEFLERARVQAAMLRGIARYLMGDFEAARADFERVLWADPEFALSRAAFCDLELGNVEGAFEGFLAANPHSPNAVAGLAIAEWAVGRKSEGAARYRIAASQEPGYCDEDWLKYGVGWGGRALRLAREILAELPTNACQKSGSLGLR